MPFEVTNATKEALVSWLAIRQARGSKWLLPSRTRSGDQDRKKPLRRGIGPANAAIGSHATAAPSDEDGGRMLSNNALLL